MNSLGSKPVSGECVVHVASHETLVLLGVRDVRFLVVVVLVCESGAAVT